MRHYQQSMKGQQGFMGKYKNLGKTERIRIPSAIFEEVSEMLNNFDLLAKDHDLQELKNVLNTFNANLRVHIKEE